MSDDPEATKSTTAAKEEDDATKTTADDDANVARISARASVRAQDALSEKMALANPPTPRTSTNTRLSERTREKADSATSGAANRPSTSDATNTSTDAELSSRTSTRASTRAQAALQEKMDLASPKTPRTSTVNARHSGTRTKTDGIISSPTVRELDPASNRRASREVLEGKMRELEISLGDDQQQDFDDDETPMPGAIRVSYATNNNHDNDATTLIEEPPDATTAPEVTAISVEEENQELQDLRQRVMDLEHQQQTSHKAPETAPPPAENPANNNTIPVASATAVDDENPWCSPKRLVPLVVLVLVVALIVLGVTLLGKNSEDTTIVVVTPTLAPTSPAPTVSSQPSLAPSLAPSMLPSSAKRFELEAMFAEFAPLHSQAMDWLTDEDTWEPPIQMAPEKALEVWKERYVLTVFYYDTNGESTWTWNEESLLSDRAACGWFGGTCNDWLIADLWLRNNGLSGTIPTLIGQLKKIRRLNLGNNDFKTTIPSEIGLLTELTNLNLYDCVLSGSIPSEIGNLVNLREFYLDTNRLVGSLPSEIGNLVSLEKFYLTGNGILGQIPSTIQSLTNLGNINFERNKFTGTIPTEIGALSNVREIAIYKNQLEGSIPESIGNMSSLTTLYLYDNKLSGSIPEVIANLTTLVSIGLNGNMLTGTVPFFAANSSIWSCDLWDNAFNDTSKGESVGCDFNGTQP